MISPAPPTLSRRILAALTKELCSTSRKWGEAPDLLLIHDQRGHVTALGMGLPDELWASQPTTDVLTWIAGNAEELGPAWSLFTPPGLIGVGMRCEAYYVTDLPAAEASALLQHQVREHPAAQQGRFACAVDRRGYTYGVETDPAGVVTGAHVAPPGNANSTAIGTVPDALDRILTAVLGLSMPPRPDDIEATDPPREEPGNEHDR